MQRYLRVIFFLLESASSLGDFFFFGGGGGQKQRGVPQIWESHLLETNKKGVPSVREFFQVIREFKKLCHGDYLPVGLDNLKHFSFFNSRENIARVKGITMTSRTSRRSLCMGCSVGQVQVMKKNDKKWLKIPYMIFPSSVHYSKVRHQKNFLVSPFLDIVLKFSSFLSPAHWSSWIICINVISCLFALYSSQATFFELQISFFDLTLC